MTPWEVSRNPLFHLRGREYCIVVVDKDDDGRVVAPSLSMKLKVVPLSVGTGIAIGRYVAASVDISACFNEPSGLNS